VIVRVLVRMGVIGRSVRVIGRTVIVGVAIVRLRFVEGRGVVFVAVRVFVGMFVFVHDAGMFVLVRVGVLVFVRLFVGHGSLPESVGRARPFGARLHRNLRTRR